MIALEKLVHSHSFDKDAKVKSVSIYCSSALLIGFAQAHLICSLVLLIGFAHLL